MKSAVYWGLPQGVALFARNQVRKYRYQRKLATMPFLLENSQFKDCHQGQRCFILGSGPSIGKQDMTLLKDDLCISISNFFVHRHYATIRPKYHCVPDVLAGHKGFGIITEANVIPWFREMAERTGEASLFLSSGDKECIDRCHLFQNKRVHHVFFGGIGEPGGSWEDVESVGLDLTRAIPGPATASVMALSIALYMGFANIYLLGCDHDWILNFGTLTHFYPATDHAAGQTDSREWWKGDHGEEFNFYASLWRQYRVLHRHAETKGIHIYNATEGGLLDVFPRVRYESLFAGC